MASAIRRVVLSATEAGAMTPPAIETRWLRLTVLRGGLGLAKTTPAGAVKIIILLRDENSAPGMPTCLTLAVEGTESPMDLRQWVWVAEQPATEVRLEFRESRHGR